MESTQAFLTSTIIVIWYAFSTLIIFDFLIGLPALMQQASQKCNTELIQAGVDGNQQSSSETPCQGLNQTSIAPISSIDEATIQYLEIVGANVDDFGSIAQARKFLDENAAWTIETLPISSKASAPEIIKKDTQPQPAQEQESKLSFEQVRSEFAVLGWILQKHRTGHNRYRVNINGLHHRFKTLQDALDWLNVSRRLIQVATR